MAKFLPEGRLLQTEENKRLLSSASMLFQAYSEERVLESRVLLCDRDHNLHLDLGCMRGIIPHDEGAIGVEDGTVRDIALISRVNKPVAFRVTGFELDANGRKYALLSRRSVQEDCVKQYINALCPGDVVQAKITHLESFGAFADVGAGVVALIPIDTISVSRIPHPGVRFNVGDDIRAVVRSIDADGRITLTHKELLGTWEQNAGSFEAGETVPGIVRSVEKYGIFVELTPNLAGLAEPSEGVSPGQHATVYIKSLLPERMKIKLIIVDAFDAEYPVKPPQYYTDATHISRWVYSPQSCPRVIESVFE